MNHGNNFGVCRKCGRQILFVRMKSGKMMPCNPQMVDYQNGGKERIVLNNGEVVAGTITNDPKDSDGYGYISHFATCEYANMFRKK